MVKANCCARSSFENSEQQGWFYLGASRGGTTTYSGVYVTVAFAAMANRVKDCDEKILDGTILASSVIGAVAVIDGVLSALLAPTFGIVADAGSKRQIVLTLPETNDAVLLIFGFITLVLSIAYEMAATLHAAYLPEITEGDNEMTHLAGKTFAVINAMQLFIAVVGTAAGISFLGEKDDDEDKYEKDFRLVRFSGALVVLLFLAYSIPGLKKIGVRHAPEEKDGRSFVQKITAASKYPDVSLFLVGYAFYYSAVQSVVSLGGLFMIEELGFGGALVGGVFACALVGSIPGAMAAKAIQKRFDLRRAVLGTIFMWGLTSCLAPLLLKGQDDIDNPKNETNEECVLTLLNDTLNNTEQLYEYEREPAGASFFLMFLFGFTWGILIGLVFPLSVSLYSILIPGGEEATYFGLKTVSAKIISWLPPLFFTIINETSQNLQLALASMIPFFVIGFIIIFFIDEERARKNCAETLSKRRKQVVSINFKGHLLTTTEEDEDKDKDTPEA